MLGVHNAKRIILTNILLLLDSGENLEDEMKKYFGQTIDHKVFLQEFVEAILSNLAYNLEKSQEPLGHVENPNPKVSEEEEQESEELSDSINACKISSTDSLTNDKLINIMTDDLLDSIKTYGTYIVTDKLPECEEEAFYFHQGSSMWLKKKTYSQDFMNPLERFEYKEVSVEDYVHDHTKYIEGNVYELLLSSYCKNNIQCIKCENSTLTWSGGSSSSWKDMECTSCNAYYEIKSKTTRAIENIRNGKHMSIRGGSFGRFFNQRCTIEKCHYLVIIDRERSDHQVFIAPINSLKPRLTSKAIAVYRHNEAGTSPTRSTGNITKTMQKVDSDSASDRLNLTVKSYIMFDKNELLPWFKLPVTEGLPSMDWFKEQVKLKVNYAFAAGGGAI
jgi:hypothetical protein